MVDEQMKGYMNVVQNKTMVLDSWARELDSLLDGVGLQQGPMNSDERQAVIKGFEKSLASLETVFEGFLETNKGLQSIYIPRKKSEAEH